MMNQKVIGKNKNSEPVPLTQPEQPAEVVKETPKIPHEILLFIFYRSEQRTQAQKARTLDTSTLKVSHYVIKKEDDRMVIEESDLKTTMKGEVIKLNGATYTQERKKDGTVVLVPIMVGAIGFDIFKNPKGKMNLHDMVKAIRKFIQENGEQGIYGLFGEGEKLSLEKWR